MSRPSLFTDNRPLPWLLRTVALALIFSAATTSLPAADMSNSYSPVADTLKLFAGFPLVPGIVAYMLTGGVHASPLADGQVTALVSIVSAGFWSFVIPTIIGLPDHLRRFVAWRRGL